MAKSAERRLVEANHAFAELIESVINRFLERDAGDEWTDQDTLFMQDVRDLYEEVGDG